MKTRALVTLLSLFTACGVEPLPAAPAPTPSEETPLQPNQQAQDLTGFPCDVRTVLQAACAGCHAQAVYFGSFSTRTELVPIAPAAQQRLTSATQPMPPYGAPRQLSVEERQVLADWFAAGAPAGACGALTAP